MALVLGTNMDEILLLSKVGDYIRKQYCLQIVISSLTIEAVTHAM